MQHGEFSFEKYASQFDRHISSSIPGYNRLMEIVRDLSPRFVQNGTDVVDLGCSTGRLLREIRRRNQGARPRARYVGLDIEGSFARRWRRASNLRFKTETSKRTR